jgi:Tfp pilus assembly protein PilF
VRVLLEKELPEGRREAAEAALVRAGIVARARGGGHRRLSLARGVLGEEDGRILFQDAVTLSAEDRREFEQARPGGGRAVVDSAPMVTTTSAELVEGLPEGEKERFEVLRQAAEGPNPPAPVLGAFAQTLAAREPSRAARMWEQALARDSANARLLGGYALSTWRKDRDLDRAQEFFERAIAADPKDAINLGNYANFLRGERRDLNRAQALFEQALASAPNHANNLGNYALFLHEERRDLDRAQALYERALTIDPKSASHLANYANLQWRERRDLDRAQALYERAFMIDSKGASHLANYAVFLWRERRDLDRAQALFEQALAVDPNRAPNLGNYANFLCDERRDLDRAQVLFERALTSAPREANNLGNYAHLLFQKGHPEAAIARLREAIQAAQPHPQPDLAVELAFYRAVHLPDERDAALRDLRRLVTEGARSPGWNLRVHATLAEKAGDADAPLFFALAEVLSAGADPAILAQFPRWTAA